MSQDWRLAFINKAIELKTRFLKLNMNWFNEPQHHRFTGLVLFIFNFIETRRPQLNHNNLAPPFHILMVQHMLNLVIKKRVKTDSTFKNGKFSVRNKITTFFSGLSKLIFGCTQPVLIACKHAKQ
jgi:hypothetical protein